MIVPVNMYKKFFKILLLSFVGIYALQMITTAFGDPFGEFHIGFPELESGKLWLWGIQPLLTAMFLDGIVNFFLTLRIIREAKGLDRWPSPAVVLMTLSFGFGVIFGTIFLIPNIIIFGLKGRAKNRVFEAEF